MEISTCLKICMLSLSVTMLGCMLASTIGNQWVALKMFDGSTSVVAVTNGLWKECGDDKGRGFMCRSIENQPNWMIGDTSWLKTCRIVALAACVLSLVAVVCCAIGFVFSHVCYVATLCCLVSGGAITTVLIMYHRDNLWTRKFNFEYGWSFNVGVVGAVVAGVAFLLGLFVGVYVEDKEIKKVDYKRHKNMGDVC